MGRKGKSYTPNEMRSNAMNPNNPAYNVATDNRSNQLNPNNPEYKGDSEDDESQILYNLIYEFS